MADVVNAGDGVWVDVRVARTVTEELVSGSSSQLLAHRLGLKVPLAQYLAGAFGYPRLAEMRAAHERVHAADAGVPVGAVSDGVRVVEKIVEVPVDRVVEKIVEKVVEVPAPDTTAGTVPAPGSEVPGWLQDAVRTLGADTISRLINDHIAAEQTRREQQRLRDELGRVERQAAELRAALRATGAIVEENPGMAVKVTGGAVPAPDPADSTDSTDSTDSIDDMEGPDGGVETVVDATGPHTGFNIATDTTMVGERPDHHNPAGFTTFTQPHTPTQRPHNKTKGKTGKKTSSKSKTLGVGSSSAARIAGVNSSDVRAWARDHNITLYPTGRVPTDVVNAYLLAHPTARKN